MTTTGKNYALDNALIVIPARGGSKGIPNKNIYDINGKPLIQYTIDFAKNLPFQKDIIVSTDSTLIRKISVDLGADCPFLRPRELSSDFVGDIPVLKHALKECQRVFDKNYKVVLMLQPTSPIRFKEQIIEGLQKFKERNLDMLISLSEVQTKFHPLKQFYLKDELALFFLRDSSKIVARQQLKKSFIRNGIFYIYKPNFLLSTRKYFSKKTGFLIIDKPYFNIDTIEDIEELKKYLLNFREK